MNQKFLQKKAFDSSSVFACFYSLYLLLISLATLFFPLNPHLMIFVTDQVQGTVTIRNISSLSSGLYQCVASNAIGTSTCLLDLQVISRKYLKFWHPLWVWNTKVFVKPGNEEFHFIVFSFSEIQ